MDGLLKALVATACVVVIAGGSWYAWEEYEKRRPPTAAEILEGHERDTKKINRIYGTNIKPSAD